MSDGIEIRYKAHKFRRGELANIFKELPRRLRGPAVQHLAAFYLLKFRLYPHYKWVTRYRAYGMQAGGKGFFSAKQRKFVMAAIRDGRIQPGRSHRTMVAKNSWYVAGKGVRASLVNDAPHAMFLYHPVYQARQTGLVGWKTVDEMTDKYEPEALADLWEYVIKLADKELENIMTGR